MNIMSKKKKKEGNIYKYTKDLRFMSKLCQHNQDVIFGNQEIWALHLQLDYNLLFVYWLNLKQDTYIILYKQW